MSEADGEQPAKKSFWLKGCLISLMAVGAVLVALFLLIIGLCSHH